MSVNIKPISASGRTEEEKIKNIESFIKTLTSDLNYSLNHLDSTNFISDIDINGVNKATQTALDNLEQKLTELINSKVQ